MTRERSAGPDDAGVYGRAHVPLLTAAEAAAADVAARDSFGVPGRVLMENAGRAAALVLHRLRPEGRIVGVAGPGNNGGDLLVMLRTLHAWGRDVAIISATSRRPDSALLHGYDLPLLEDADAHEAAAHADIFVDGMLGTGAEGALRGAVAEWTKRISESRRSVVALDMPTGIDPTSGAVHDGALHADVTVTFGWPKLGLLLHPARAHCGRIVAVDIGFPELCAAAHARVITSAFVHDHLKPRDATAHKGSAGRLLILAGQEGMAGAAAIAGNAAMRSGAGLIRIASAAANRIILQSLVPEATFLDRTQLAPDDLEPMHALLAGPGLGTDNEARDALHSAFELMRGKPTLLDADALNMLAGDTDALRNTAASAPLLITPHARELSRLTGDTLAHILADPVAAARSAARDFGCVVLLKGQPSIVASPDGELDVNSVGSSDVATAGMGDQLSGVCAALLAAGYDPRLAACLGLHISGRAADLAGLGRSLTPADVTAQLARAMADPGPSSSDLALPFVLLDQAARW